MFHVLRSVSGRLGCLIPNLKKTALLKKTAFIEYRVGSARCSVQYKVNFCKEKTEDDVQKELANLNEFEQKKLKIVQLEYDAWLALGAPVPENITDDVWLDIVKNYHSMSSRKKYYSFLFKNDKRLENEKKKKAARYIKHSQRLAEKQQMLDEGLLPKYKNTFLLRIREATMNKWYYNNLFYTLMFGPRIVIDFNFEGEMSKLELKNLVNQLKNMHGMNKIHKEPVHLHFCNLRASSNTYQMMDHNILPYYSISENDYLNHYPKERLVYLTPDSPNIMRQFNEEDVYVIGGIVDKGQSKPLTMAKAKQEKIRTAKLPLDKYLRWAQGGKSLTLDQMLGILLDIRTTKNWHKALEHVPKRKIHQL